MRILVVLALVACGSRTSLEAPEPPRTAVALAQRIATIDPRPVEVQPATEITGIVVDAHGTEVEGVLVEVLVDGEPFENTTSDGMGQYVLAVPPAAYHIRFRYDDWSFEHDIVAVAGERTWANTTMVEREGVTLEREGVTLAEHVVNIPVPVEGFHCGSQSLENQYYVDGININGLTFGDAAPDVVVAVGSLESTYEVAGLSNENLVFGDVGTAETTSRTFGGVIGSGDVGPPEATGRMFEGVLDSGDVGTPEATGRTFESALGSPDGASDTPLDLSSNCGVENVYVVDDVPLAPGITLSELYVRSIQFSPGGFTETATNGNVIVVDGEHGRE